MFFVVLFPRLKNLLQHYNRYSLSHPTLINYGYRFLGMWNACVIIAHLEIRTTLRPQRNIVFLKRIFFAVYRTVEIRVAKTRRAQVHTNSNGNSKRWSHPFESSGRRSKLVWNIPHKHYGNALPVSVWFRSNGIIIRQTIINFVRRDQFAVFSRKWSKQYKFQNSNNNDDKDNFKVILFRFMCPFLCAIILIKQSVW